jgi:hypothetical protein
MSPDTTAIIAPPWSLRGNGYIFPYRFDRDFVIEHGRVPDELQSQYRGGIGSVMLVDYEQSPVGPYQELLFIPGRFQFGRRRYYMVTQIYVSTQVSVENGQENWGIPKQLAQFHFETVDERVKQFTVGLNDQPFFHAETQAGILRFPVNSWFNPFPARLLQQRYRDGQLLSTVPSVRGTLSLSATLQLLEIDPAYFPDVTTQQPLAAVEAVEFRMTFPTPTEV